MAINKNKVIASAQKYVQKGQLDKAIREYAKIVEAEPGDVRTWLKIGDLQAKKGAADEAIETYLRVADHYSEQGFYLKAVAVFKQVLRLKPRFVEVHFKLAALYKQLGLVTDSRRQLEASYQVLQQEGEVGKSLEVLKAMVELDPDNVAVRIRLAETFSREEQTAEAVEEFTRAADILRSAGRVDDFIRVAERLIWHQADNVSVIKELALLYLRRKDPRRALQKLQLCYKADEKDTETLNLLVTAFLELEQREKGVTILKVLATVHEEKGELDHRDDVFRRILELDPADAEAREALREATGVSPVDGSPRAPAEPVEEVDLADVEEIEEIQELEEIEGFEEIGEPDEAADQIATLYGEAEVYEKFGLLREAVDQLERALQVEPDNPETQRRLKELYIKLDRIDDAVNATLVLAASKIESEPDEAADLLREALELDPDNRRAQEMLADIPGQEPKTASRRSSINLASRWQMNESDAQILDDIAAEAYTEEPSYATEEIDIEALERELEERDGEPSARFEPVRTEHAASAGDGLGPGRESDVELELDLAEAGLEYLEDQLNAETLDPQEDDLLLDPLLDEPLEAAPRGSVPDDDLEVDLAGLVADLDEAQDPDLLEQQEEQAWDSPDEDLSVDLDFDVEEPGEPEVTAVVDADEIGRRAEAAALDDDLGLPPEGHAAMAPDDLFQDELRQLEEAEELVASLASPEAPAAAEPEPSADAGLEIEPEPLADAGLEIEPEPLADAGLEIEPEPAEGFAPAVTVEEPAPAPAPAPAPEIEVPEELAEEMEEAEFFIAQGLLEDALGMLRDLVQEQGEHPALRAKIDELKAQIQDEGEDPLEAFGDELGDALDGLEAPGEAEPQAGGRLNIPRGESDAFHQFKEGVAKQVGEDDADTHFDVGIAYREMGMFADAIGEFDAAMRPHNEVQCHLMIALCHRAQGAFSEAVNIYKKALYCEQISDNEQVDIYYQMGQTYEELQDPREAAYYYEKVDRLVDGYRDVSERLAELQASLDPTKGPDRQEVDSAFDELVGLPSGDAD